MRKYLLASIVFGAVGGAHAQGSVTLYGALDTGLLYQSNTAGGPGKGFAAINGGWGPSFWGFTGSEDIGDEYRIHFKVEGGYSTVTGGIGDSNGNFLGRQTYVGVDMPFGTLNAGLQFSPFFISVYGGDPRGLSFFSSSLSEYINSFGVSGLFESNAVVYSSPSFAGLRGSVEYAFGNVAGSFPAGRHISAAVNYGNGPVTATAAYFEAKDPTSGTTTLRGENVGAGYKFGPVTVKLAFTNYRDPASDAVLKNVNVYSVGAQWMVTYALALDAGVYASRDENVTANKSMLYGAGAEYFLSKRTTLYVQLGMVDNKGAMNTSLTVEAPNRFNVPQGTTIGVDLGIRHSF